MKIKKADVNDLPEIAPLFDAYRVFYEQKSDQKRASDFLKERFTNQETTIFLAIVDSKAVGFTQLYKTFSSVSMEAFYILNDLYVIPEFRKKGVGEALLNAAKDFCMKKNAKGLALETATDNPAQKLYERLGWKKDTDFFHYFWKNKQR